MFKEEEVTELRLTNVLPVEAGTILYPQPCPCSVWYVAVALFY